MRPILVNYHSVWFQKASGLTANITSVMNNLKNLTGNGQLSLLISCFVSSQRSFWRNMNKTFSFSCVQHKIGMILELVSLMRSCQSLSCKQLSADEHAFLCGKALPVHVVLLQFFVARVPEPGEDALHVQGIHGVGGHHTTVNLHQANDSQ